MLKEWLSVVGDLQPEWEYHWKRIDQRIGELPDRYLAVGTIELSDLKVHVYGSTAVAAGTSTVRGTYKGRS